MTKNKLTSNLGRSLARRITNTNANSLDRLIDQTILPELKKFYGTKVWDSMSFEQCASAVGSCVRVAVSIVSNDKTKVQAATIINRREW